MYDLPIYIWALVTVAALGIPALTAAALFRTAVAAGTGRRTAATVAATLAAGWAGWLVATGVLAAAGAYSAKGIPWFLVAFAGALGTPLLATRIPVVARVLADPGTPARLAVPHTLRVIGVVFLVVLALGHLPAVFALPAGLGDIAIGVAAPFVARRLARGGGRRAAVRFNVLGIVDLVVAAGTALLVGYGVLDVTPNTDALRLLPLALVPTAAVPLAIALHVVSLTRLRAAATPARRPAAALST